MVLIEPTYIPDSLVAEVKRRILCGEDTCESFAAIRSDHRLDLSQAVQRAPMLFSDTRLAVAQTCIVSAVDFDNDGIEDLFAFGKLGYGQMGMWENVFCKGNAQGSYTPSYSFFTCAYTPLFITWENQTYLLCIQQDTWVVDEAPITATVKISLHVFYNGWEYEQVDLDFYPNLIFDDSGHLLRVDFCEVSQRQIKTQVYTRFVNTYFGIVS